MLSLHLKPNTLRHCQHAAHVAHDPLCVHRHAHVCHDDHSNPAWWWCSGTPCPCWWLHAPAPWVGHTQLLWRDKWGPCTCACLPMYVFVPAHACACVPVACGLCVQAAQPRGGWRRHPAGGCGEGVPPVQPAGRVSVCVCRGGGGRPGGSKEMGTLMRCGHTNTFWYHGHIHTHTHIYIYGLSMVVTVMALSSHPSQGLTQLGRGPSSEHWF